MTYEVLVWLVAAAFAGIPISVLLAVVTGAWQWLILGFVCWAIVHPLFKR